MTATTTALVGFAAWQVALTIALATYRTALVQTGGRQANSFAPDGSDVGGWGQRLTRARDNCYENLPVFAAIVLGASLGGRTGELDGLAMTVLYARVGQSITHIVSTSVPAVLLRFAFYLVQIAIFTKWVVGLLWGV